MVNWLLQERDSSVVLVRLLAVVPDGVVLWSKYGVILED
jgi:hypothetical protein